MLLNEEAKWIESQTTNQDIKELPIGDISHLHYDPISKAARDISKVGVSGAEAKFLSD